MEQAFREPVNLIPQPKQAMVLACPANEILFGGARGGGKTACEIFDYLNQYLFVLQGKASGVIFRRTYSELEDIIVKCQEFLEPFGFKRNKGDETYRNSKDGAFLKLRYLESDADADRYQGHGYSWIGIDECGNFKSFLGVDKLKATLRGFGIRPRLVLSANPGGRAHEILKARFSVKEPYKIITDNEGWSRVYIPSLFKDNLALMNKDPDYLTRAVSGLPEYLKRAWRDGDWDISSEAGMFFSREDFRFVEHYEVPQLVSIGRGWDRAASEPSDKYPDPDWTAGVKMGIDANGIVYVLDVVRFRKKAADVKSRMYAKAQDDGKACSILIYQDPGQAGKDQAENMTSFLSEFDVRVLSESGKKHTRWNPFSAAIQNGTAKLVRGAWNAAYIDELVMLTDNPEDYAHDDQADASSGVYSYIVKPGFEFVRIGGDGAMDSRTSVESKLSEVGELFKSMKR